MNRPPPPHMMGNMYRGPRPFNNRWRPRGPHPPPGFPCRPNNYYRTPVTNTKDNEEHWCETCDRGFPTADLLDKHKQQHQKCNIDGCQFVAHPKVITKHIQMQHSSGLYKKIAKLNNPEEINKWREERKKKYPTRTNIEKKEAECKEKIERGEKMALKQDRMDNNNKSSTDQSSAYKRRHSFDKRDQNHRPNGPNFNQRQNYTNNKNQPPAKKIPKVIPKVPSVVEKNKLKPFTGILSIEIDDDDKKDEEEECKTECNNTLIEDDYYEETVTTEHTKVKSTQEPVLCGALSSLMCDYGTSDEEIDEKENKTLINVKKTDPVQNIGKKEVKDQENINSDDKSKSVSVNMDMNRNMDMNSNKDTLVMDTKQIIETKPNENGENSDDDGPEEVKTIKSIVQEPSCSEQDTIKDIKPPLPAKKNIPFKSNQRQTIKYKHKIPSTLLYKLLRKEIRQERNIVLQCIRYIKKMNYFDKTS